MKRELVEGRYQRAGAGGGGVTFLEHSFGEENCSRDFTIICLSQITCSYKIKIWAPDSTLTSYKHLAPSEADLQIRV